MILVNVLVVFVFISGGAFAAESASKLPQLPQPIIGSPAGPLDRDEKTDSSVTDRRINVELVHDDQVFVNDSVDGLIDKSTLIAAINQYITKMAHGNKSSVQVGVEINNKRPATQVDVLDFCAIKFKEKMKCAEYDGEHSRKITLAGAVTVSSKNSGDSDGNIKYNFMILIDGEDRIVISLVAAQAVQAAIERFANPWLPDSFFIMDGYFSSIQYGVAVFKPNAENKIGEIK